MSTATTTILKSKQQFSRADWLVPLGLVLLSLVPMLAGTMRVAELSNSATEITVENARFFAAPIPVIIHIINSSLYAILGAFQFSRRLRLWKRGWHRNIGNVLIILGLLVSLSGLWMTLFYPWPEGDGVALYIMRLIVGSAMTLFLILGYFAARRHDYVQHGNWMMRAYALGLGAGTQVFTHLPWFILFGKPDEFPRAALMAAGWLINILVVEWIIRRRPTRSRRTSTRKNVPAAYSN